MLHGLIFSIGIPEARSVGSHRIATHLRQQGWDIEVLDFFLLWRLDELKTYCRSRITDNTKFVGFSLLFGRNGLTQVNGILLRKWIRETYPNVMIITGGQNIQLDHVLLENIDYHIGGYGELAIEALLKYKFGNGSRVKINLLNTVGKTKVINALADYPAYPFRDPSIYYEHRDFIFEHEWGLIEFSRGCRFSCSFCNFPVLGVKEDYTRSVESAELQLRTNFDKWGMKDYIITDETFNDRTDKITKFANMIEKLPFRSFFTAFIRADLLIKRPKDREELLRMGVLGHFYGIETFNPKSAKIIKKGMDPEIVKQGLIEIKNYYKTHTGRSFRADIGLIAGLPHETLDSLESTLQWTKQNWKDQSIGVHPLEIRKNSFAGRSSDIDLNWQEYGYREMSSENLKQYLNRSTATDDRTDKDVTIDWFELKEEPGIFWENDNMNIFQAVEWCERIPEVFDFGRNHRMGVIPPFALGEIIVDENGKIWDTEKKLRAVMTINKDDWLNINQRHTENRMLVIRQYIHKKLSYRS